MKCCYCESDSLPKSFLISVSVKQFPRSLKSLLRSLISNVCDKKKKKESMKIQLFLEPENIIWRKKNQQTREKIEEKKFRICRIFFSSVIGYKLKYCWNICSHSESNSFPNFFVMFVLAWYTSKHSFRESVKIHFEDQ